MVPLDFPIITRENGSRQPTFIIVTGILLAMSIVVVCGRFFCRIHHIKHVALDDYFIAVALCVTIALATMNMLHIRYGTGLHITDLPLDLAAALIPTLKYWYAYQIIYPLALVSVKLSFLALYRRIFGKSRAFRLWIWAVGGVVVVYTVAAMFVSAFECGSNVSQAWNPTFPQGCINLPAAYFSTASINIVTDTVILVMPIRPLMHLQLNDRKRYALIAIFMVGSIAVAASIVRLHAIYLYLHTEDVSYDAIFILLWSQIEINLAIICASVPTLRPLFARTFGTVHSRSSQHTPSDRPGASSGVGHSRSRPSADWDVDSMAKRESKYDRQSVMGPDSEEITSGKGPESAPISRTNG